jgi:hypothetical protein
MSDNFNFYTQGLDLANPISARGVQNITLGDSFSGIHARGDALQSWCWYCVPPLIINAEAFSNDSLVASAPGVWLPWYYVQAATIPDRTIEKRTTQRNGHAMHFPKSYSMNELTLTLFLDSKNVARQWLRSWSEMVVSQDNPRNASNQGRWGLPYQYKRDISFVVHSVRKKRVLHYKYIGCWPTNTGGLGLTSGESTALTCDVTFSVDDVRVSVGNESIIESFWIPNDIV